MFDNELTVMNTIQFNKTRSSVRITGAHVSICRLHQALKIEQSSMKANYEQVVAGDTLERQREYVYIDAAANLLLELYRIIMKIQSYLTIFAV